METLQVNTRKRGDMVDITTAVCGLINENGWSDGVLLLYCPHTTGAVAVKMSDMKYRNAGQVAFVRQGFSARIQGVAQ